MIHYLIDAQMSKFGFALGAPTFSWDPDLFETKKKTKNKVGCWSHLVVDISQKDSIQIYKFNTLDNRRSEGWTSIFLALLTICLQ